MLFVRYYFARSLENGLGIVGFVLAGLAAASLIKEALRGVPPDGLLIGFFVVAVAILLPSVIRTLRLVQLVKTGEARAAEIEKIATYHAFSSVRHNRTQTLVLFSYVDAAGTRAKGSVTLDGAAKQWERLRTNAVVILNPRKPDEPTLDLFGTRQGEGS